MKEDSQHVNRKCTSCKYLSKVEKWSAAAQCKFVYSCKKGMINISEDLSPVKLDDMRCGYYVERIENEQLSLFM